MEILNIFIKVLGLAIYNILLFSFLNMKNDKKKTPALVSLVLISLMIWSM